MGNTLSMSHPPFFVSEPNLTPSDKKLGRALGKVFFESTETIETKETTAKQSIIRMIINFSVVPVVSVVPAVPAVSKQLILREAHLTFHFSVFTLTIMAARWTAIVVSIAPFR